MLTQLVDNKRTNINTTHSYLDLYQQLLQHQQHSAVQVLELGNIQLGGDILLWYQFFHNATITGIDTMSRHQLPTDLLNNDRIHVYPETDPYDRMVPTYFNNIGTKFDIIIDNGSHSFENMVRFIMLYLPLLNDSGTLIIQNIPQLEWCGTFELIVPMQFQQCIRIYDRRSIKGQFDDIIFVVDKNLQT